MVSLPRDDVVLDRAEVAGRVDLGGARRRVEAVGPRAGEGVDVQAGSMLVEHAPDGLLERVGSARIAEHVPPEREPTTRPEVPGHLGEADGWVDPVKRGGGGDEIEVRERQLGRLERPDDHFEPAPGRAGAAAPRARARARPR